MALAICNKAVKPTFFILLLEHNWICFYSVFLLIRFFVECQILEPNNNQVVKKNCFCYSLKFQQVASIDILRVVSPSCPQKYITIIISVCLFELEDSQKLLWISGCSLNEWCFQFLGEPKRYECVNILFFRSAYWKMDIRPNHTLYINNVNDKIKKEGMK